MREFLKGLDLDRELIDTIMAEHGKLITESKEKVSELNDKVREYETKLNEFSQKSENTSKMEEELNTLKSKIAEESLDKTIAEAVGDKKFVNEYTKNAFYNEMKTALKDEANVGKSAKDLFTSMTKDKKDIFVSKNQVKDMASIEDVDVNTTAPAKGEGFKVNPMFKTYN